MLHELFKNKIYLKCEKLQMHMSWNWKDWREKNVPIFNPVSSGRNNILPHCQSGKRIVVT